jgi:hypothetical protein
LAIKEISLMESRAVGYNFERGPLDEHDHPCKVLFKCECVLQTDDREGFQRRLKCEKLTDDRRQKLTLPLAR